MSLRSSHWIGWRSNKPGSRVSEEALWFSFALCVWFRIFSSLVGNAWTPGESINATIGAYSCAEGLCPQIGIVTRNAVTTIKPIKNVKGNGKRLLPSHTPPCFSVSHNSRVRLFSRSSANEYSGLSNFQAMFLSSPHLFQAGQNPINQRPNLGVARIIRHLEKKRSLTLAVRRILGTPLGVIDRLAFRVLLAPQVIKARHKGIRLHYTRIEKVHHHPLARGVSGGNVQDVRRLTVRTKGRRHFAIKVSKEKRQSEDLPVLSLLRQQRMAPPAALRDIDGFAFTYVVGVLFFRGCQHFLGGPASGGCFVNDIGPFLTVDFGTLNGEYRAAIAVSLINLTLLQAEPLHSGAQVIGMVDARCERSARFIDVCSNWRINGLARFGIFIQNHRKGFSISAYCRIFITKSNDATIRQGFIQPYPSRFCRAEVKARERQGNGH